MDLSQILTFCAVTGLLVMSLGPNGVLIAKTVPSSGRIAGLANVAGFVAAFYLHGALSILGISLILVQSATAFTVVKYLGAAYLCWIGVQSLIAAIKGNHATAKVAAARSKWWLREAFFEGFLTNALNPKVSMFYLAAFPQFIQKGAVSAFSSFLLVFLHSILNALWFGMMVLMFANLMKAARSVGFQRVLKAVTGIVFVGFSLQLASYEPAR